MNEDQPKQTQEGLSTIYIETRVAEKGVEFRSSHPDASEEVVQKVENNWRFILEKIPSANKMEQQIHIAYAEKSEDSLKRMREELLGLEQEANTASSNEDREQVLSKIQALVKDMQKESEAARERRELAGEQV